MADMVDALELRGHLYPRRGLPNYRPSLRKIRLAWDRAVRDFRHDLPPHFRDLEILSRAGLVPPAFTGEGQ